MPASLTQFASTAPKAYNSSQKAKASSRTETLPVMMTQIKTLANKDPPQAPTTKRATSPGSPSPAVLTVAGGDIRTYSQFPLPRNPSSWLMQSQQLHQDQTHRRLSSSSLCQHPRPQQQTQKIQQLFHLSAPSSSRDNVEGDAAGNSSADPGDDGKEGGDEKKREEEDKPDEDRREDHPQQEEGEQQSLPSTTRTNHPTWTPSPLVTLFSAPSSPISSSPPLYNNETTGESMTTAEALAVFLDQPVLATPQEFIQSVARMEEDAWGGDGRSRSYIIADEEDTGVSKQRKESNKWSAAKTKKDEDYELEEWKCSSAEDQCPVPAKSGNQSFTQTASTVGNLWKENSLRSYGL
ncbi:uncharacterized protein PG998_012519 [Apiospora kogelbergensis]|uniref:uncharacterized protein n=1 Tax=Apiospora kogelbergensis TaxID=1337665 RepID=UPI003131A025